MLLTDLLGDKPPTLRQRRLARTIAVACLLAATAGALIPSGWWLP